MNSYLAIFSIRIKALLQYRIPALAGIITQFFWGLILMMIMKAFYSETLALQPLTLPEAITFIWLGQALLQLLPWSIDKEVEALVKNGNVAYEMVRPVDLWGLWFTRSLALRFTPTLMRSIPIFLFASFLGLMAPVSLGSGIVFGISIIFSLLLSTAIATFVLITLFWTHTGEGIQRILPQFSLFFSGMIVPLPLFPSWMQPFLNFQPFRGIMDIPCRIYTGVIPINEAFYFLLFQLFWIFIFCFFGKMLLKKAIKKFVIQGG